MKDYASGHACILLLLCLFFRAATTAVSTGLDFCTSHLHTNMEATEARWGENEHISRVVREKERETLCGVSYIHVYILLIEEGSPTVYAWDIQSNTQDQDRVKCTNNHSGLWEMYKKSLQARVKCTKNHSTNILNKHRHCVLYRSVDGVLPCMTCTNNSFKNTYSTNIGTALEWWWCPMTTDPSSLAIRVDN
jgi:hypothetical protein